MILGPQRTGRQTVELYRSSIIKSGINPVAGRIKLMPSLAELRAFTDSIKAASSRGLSLESLSEIVRLTSRDVVLPFTAKPHERYKIGLRPGSDDPLHLGHVSAGLAAMLHRDLNGVVFTLAGRVPDKPFNSSHVHRLDMAKMTLDKFSPYLHLTDIRHLTAEELGQWYLDTQNNSLEEMRSFTDIVAFTWILRANPHCSWYYIIGGDKFSNYARKNEKPLIYNTLHMNNVKFIYFEVKGKEINEQEIRSREWLEAMMYGMKVFERCAIQSHDVSATDVRRKLVNGDQSAADDIDIDVFTYIKSDPALEELYALNNEIKEKAKAAGCKTEKEQSQFAKDYVASEEGKARISKLRQQKAID